VKNKGNIAVFGGTFDPPHQGHIDALLQLLSLGFQTVVVAPTTQNPYKSASPTPLHHRVAMLRLAISHSGIPPQEHPFPPSNDPSVFVSDFEYNRVWQFVEYWKDQFPSTSISWVVGEDIADQVQSWERWSELKMDIVVLKERVATHSTQVRSGEAAPHAAIVDYIAEHQLYQ
jgi:nicotinate-nucleotide adenylyltransferase